ncbi:EFR1 family ferrodoxin [uncultured Methanomethylovorans sp.]|uniref:EFR1 family ferrodoxin n=1 Tax=uncultured Methanomethylovorans sp. TaxID=183759 RepID=UPI0026232F89|nr:EFR1 family ferrodoxin [uncultured Methanomethylovorans sp.]
MTASLQIKTVKIAYFSGTGSTARVAGAFEDELNRRGLSVIRSEIRGGNLHSDEKEDLLILLFPVHAFNAPRIVYQWIDGLPGARQIPVAVISVSGGGEISPNTACRLSSIRRLEKKNYRVVYEKMMVIPSNWVMRTDDGLAIRLLRVLPSKVECIVDDLVQGVVRRTRPKLIDHVFSMIGELEKTGARFFGRDLRVNDTCNGCSWCLRNCPSNNITMLDNKPVFGEDCILCLKCIYGCPTQAIGAGALRFIVLKEGYDLQALEKRMHGAQLTPVEDLARGYIWKGVKEYLLED